MSVELRVVAAATVGLLVFFALEWSAAPAFTNGASGKVPTRHLTRSGLPSRYWSSSTLGRHSFAQSPPFVVNEACRNICEPHCAARWGTSDWTFPLQKGCFLMCIDKACQAR